MLCCAAVCFANLAEDAAVCFAVSGAIMSCANIGELRPLTARPNDGKCKLDADSP